MNAASWHRIGLDTIDRLTQSQAAELAMQVSHSDLREIASEYFSPTEVSLLMRQDKMSIIRTVNQKYKLPDSEKRNKR